MAKPSERTSAKEFVLMRTNTALMGCCGLVGMHGFWKRGQDQFSYDQYSTESDEAFIRRSEKAIRRTIEETRGRKPFYLISLRQSQYRILHDMLLSNGFEVLREALNRNSGNQIRLYLYDNSDYQSPPWDKKPKRVLEKSAFLPPDRSPFYFYEASEGVFK